ncbi:4'-phosphopantetheinyl transferase family protein [Streptomyces sp. NBC_01288]|uniref:4'-phosphopantetheinyl transferase family protein n=1 Tax=Streptomyces sp. NBC_01288 TaxID=2903814 RepID=UPI003FA38207
MPKKRWSLAVPGRRREFAAVRACARRALASLSAPSAAILPDERGAPVWPYGFTDSLTHCAGYRTAAVAGVTDLMSMGIDAEPHAPLPQGVLPHIASHTERRHFATLSSISTHCHWGRLLFCAKESLYKAGVIRGPAADPGSVVLSRVHDRALASRRCVRHDTRLLTRLTGGGGERQ